jgi:histidyl-tRNA synthetase
MADKSEKSNKLKAHLPRGLAGRGPAEIAATRDMIEKIRAVCTVARMPQVRE